MRLLTLPLRVVGRVAELVAPPRRPSASYPAFLTNAEIDAL